MTTCSVAEPRLASRRRTASTSSIHRLRSGGAAPVVTAVHTIQIPSATRETPTKRSITRSTESGTRSANRIAAQPSTMTIAA